MISRMSMQTSSTSWAMHIARSKFIDTFAFAEYELLSLMDRLAIARNHLLGQNIDALKKVAPSPKFSKASQTQLQAAVATFSAIQSIRCDVVHGGMELITMKGQAVACFINAQQVNTLSAAARLLTLEQLDHLNCTMAGIAKQLRAISPPAPSATQPALSVATNEG